MMERLQDRFGEWTELKLPMKDRKLRFEVVAEDEWRNKLNELFE